MNTKTVPLPAFFVGTAVFSGVLLGALLAVRTGAAVAGIFDHPHPVIWIALTTFAIGMATWATVLESRNRNRDVPSERVRYREAIKSGQPSGDVRGWPEWIKRDRMLNIFSWIGVAWFAWMGFQAIVYGPRWAAILLLPLAVSSAWSVWRTRRRLLILSERLSAPTE
jgi:membrane protein implicated in regulation of membrane protease activity